MIAAGRPCRRRRGSRRRRTAPTPRTSSSTSRSGRATPCRRPGPAPRRTRRTRRPRPRGERPPARRLGGCVPRGRFAHRRGHARGVRITSTFDPRPHPTPSSEPLRWAAGRPTDTPCVVKPLRYRERPHLSAWTDFDDALDHAAGARAVLPVRRGGAVCGEAPARQAHALHLAHRGRHVPHAARGGALPLLPRVDARLRCPRKVGAGWGRPPVTGSRCGTTGGGS